MRIAGLVFLGCLSLAVAGCGCGKTGPVLKKTYKITGKVTVDGQPPGSKIQIGVHNVGAPDPKMPTEPQAETNEDGNFEIATYFKGDGVPEGSYKLTFSWQDFQLFSRSYSGPDKLNKRYSDPAKSEILFTVESMPVDLGEIKLTTK